MARYSFDIEDETRPAEGYAYASRQQREKAEKYGAVRIYKTRYILELPQYILAELAANLPELVFGFAMEDYITDATCELDDMTLDEAVELTHEMVETVNERIEDYLRAIDNVYGTSYAPTGYARLEAF